MVGIYKITSPTNKIYIGQSKDIKRRKNTYSILNCKKQTLLYNSLKKYGFENHKFEVLQGLPIDITQEILDNFEIFFIRQYKYCGFKMLNLTEGGKNGKRYELSKIKTAKSIKKVYSTEEGKIKQGKRMLGKHHSEETKKLLSKKKKGKPLPYSAVQNSANKRRGCKVSEEIKKKISNSHKSRIITKEEKEKRIKDATKHSSEFIKQIEIELLNNTLHSEISSKYNISEASLRYIIKTYLPHCKRFKK
jgi:group I intron endonuclease